MTVDLRVRRQYFSNIRKLKIINLSVGPERNAIGKILYPKGVEIRIELRPVSVQLALSARFIASSLIIDRKSHSYTI